MINHSVPQMVDSDFVLDIILRVHNLKPFKNFVFYSSRNLVEDTDISSDFFQHFLEKFPDRPLTLIVDNEMPMSGFLSIPTMCIVLTTGHEDPIMQVAARSLKGVRYFKTIFILFPLVNSSQIYHSFKEYHKFLDTIQLTYDWVWKKQFLNTILLTINNEVYLLNPYPKPEILNKSLNSRPEEIFINHKDLKGYQIKSPVCHDMPRVFYMTQGKQSDNLSGVSAKLFKEFVHYINATFVDTKYADKKKNKFEPVDINGLINQVLNRQLEISLHSFTDLTSAMGGSSYPIGINDWCIMVPFRNRSPEHMYLLQSFQHFTWLLVCFSVLYITLGIWLCTPSRKRDLSLSFIQSICSIIMAVPLRILSQPTVRMRFIYVQLFVMGFFITNVYITKMASFRTASPSQPQIDTVEDVIKANLPIMILEYEYNILKAKNFSSQFFHYTVLSTKHDMDMHRDRLNNSYGYSVQTDRWNFLNRQQKYMKKPLFRLTSICIGPFYHVFPLQKDSHLGRHLQYFIMTAAQYGLFEYWETKAFADALYMGYVHMMTGDNIPMPMTTTFFRFIWIIWAVGMLVGILVFCIEVKGKKWKRTIQQYLQYLLRAKVNFP